MKCLNCNKHLDKFYEKCPFCEFDLFYKDRYDVIVKQTFPSNRLLYLLSEISKMSKDKMNNIIKRRDFEVAKSVNLSKATRIKQKLIKAGATVEIGHSLKTHESVDFQDNETALQEENHNKILPKKAEKKSKSKIVKEKKVKNSILSIFFIDRLFFKAKKANNDESTEKWIILLIICFFFALSLFFYYLLKLHNTVNTKPVYSPQKTDIIENTFRDLEGINYSKYIEKINQGKRDSAIISNPVKNDTYNYHKYKTVLKNYRQQLNNREIPLEKFELITESLQNELLDIEDFFLILEQKDNQLKGLTNAPDNAKFIYKFVHESNKIIIRKIIVKKNRVNIRLNNFDKGKYTLEIYLEKMENQLESVKKNLEKFKNYDLEIPIEIFNIQIEDPKKLEVLIKELNESIGNEILVQISDDLDFKELIIEKAVSKDDDNDDDEEFIFKLCAMLTALRVNRVVELDSIKIKTKKNTYNISLSVIQEIINNNDYLDNLQLAEIIFKQIK